MQQFLPAPTYRSAFITGYGPVPLSHPIEPDWTLDDTSAYNSALSGEHSTAESSRGAAFGGLISVANYDYPQKSRQAITQLYPVKQLFLF
ncbi:hypothetical protein CDAR_367361 [Caerostris darwini]|uniref:Uncharacterized protein n=1 Tax=Caerostris darwini TaxID=1538125 RepID=A0AAV4WH38_9ARAC|nr:hypothetical protein CDAR_367361 [Caerostris darwini]